jgi:hypothetical protein
VPKEKKEECRFKREREPPMKKNTDLKICTPDPDIQSMNAVIGKFLPGE